MSRNATFTSYCGAFYSESDHRNRGCVSLAAPIQMRRAGSCASSIRREDVLELQVGAKMASSIASRLDIPLFFLMICLDAIQIVLLPRAQQTLYRCGMRQVRLVCSFKLLIHGADRKSQLGLRSPGFSRHGFSCRVNPSRSKAQGSSGNSVPGLRGRRGSRTETKRAIE